MDPAKFKAILDWEAPNSVKDVQCFLGFANFYRRFIHKYSNLCQPLFNLLRKPENQEKPSKNTPFVWSPDCENVFSQLKRAFTSAPILRHFDPDLETILECDASDYVISGVLSQKYPHHDPDTGKTQFILHPVAYMSEKMTPAECNYGIGNKELLAIITALEKWYIYLYQLPQTFTILTDHHNLQTFTTKTLLSRRQARWAQEVFECLKNGTKRHPVVPLGECTISDDLLLVNKLVYVLNKNELFLRILKECHDHPAA